MCIQGWIIPGGLDLQCLHCSACLMLQDSRVIPPGMADEGSGPAFHHGWEMGFTLPVAYFSRKLGERGFPWLKRVVMPTSSDWLLLKRVV